MWPRKTLPRPAPTRQANPGYLWSSSTAPLRIKDACLFSVWCFSCLCLVFSRVVCLTPRSSIVVIVYRCLGTTKATWGKSTSTHVHTVGRYIILLFFFATRVFCFLLVRIGRATGHGEAMKRRPPKGFTVVLCCFAVLMSGSAR